MELPLGSERRPRLAHPSRWNALAKEYEKWVIDPKNGMGLAFSKAITKAILSRIPRNRSLRLIDVGCGDGSFLHRVSKRCAMIRGIDASSEMTRIAVCKHPHLKSRLSVHDITVPLPFADCSFDIAVCNMVLMDVPAIDKAISEIYRILVSGGVFIQTTNHPSFSFARHHLAKRGRRYLDVFRYKHFLGATVDLACYTYHRPVQFYVECLLRSRFVITSFEEVAVGTALRRELETYRRTANALLIECRKSVPRDDDAVCS